MFRLGSFTAMYILFVGVSNVWTINIDIVSLVTFSMKNPGAVFSLSAMDIAVENVKRQYGSIANFSHVRLFGRETDSCENIADSSDYNLAKWYYTEKRSDSYAVFIWPACLESINVRLLAAGWNILFITSAGSDSTIRDRATGPTWISMSSGSIPGYAHLFMNLLARFRWNSVFVLVDEASLGFYLESGATFIKLAGEIARNVTLTVRRFNSVKTPDVAALLETFRKVSRVCIFFGHARVFRNLTIKARQANMTNGEYVYIASQLAPIKPVGNFTWNYGDSQDQVAKDAFQSVLLIDQIRDAGGTKVSRLVGQFQERQLKQYNMTISVVEAMIAMPAYTAIVLYGQILNKLVTSNQTDLLGDGANLAYQYFINKTLHTDARSIYIDPYGQRLLDLVVTKYFDNDTWPTPILYQNAQTFDMQQISNWTWYGKKDHLPHNKPLCGYSGNECSEADGLTRIYTVSIAILAVILFLLVIGTVIALRCRSSWMMQFMENWWALNPDLFSLNSSFLLHDMRKKEISSTTTFQRKSALRATYEGQPIWITASAQNDLHHPTLVCSKASTDFRCVMKLILSANTHTNINRLIGILTLRDIRFVLSEKASRGSLHDLFDRNLLLDQDLKQSFIHDLCEGINFIHTSLGDFHGSMTGSKCLVNKHFILKIGEFGCDRLLCHLNEEKHISKNATPHKCLYWAAPELAQGFSLPSRATDIYAVGVILVEILTSNYPYEDDHGFYGNDLYAKIASGEINPLTSSKATLKIPPEWNQRIEATFDISPSKRPTISKIQRTLSGHDDFGSTKGSDKFLDKIMARLDRYAAELEERVVKQTNEFIKERVQCDTILRQILPGYVVEKLRRNELVDAEVFESVTVMFFSLCGLETIVLHRQLVEVPLLLDIVETQLDTAMSEVDAFKVEAVADTVMVVSGAPVRNGIRHVGEICKLILLLQSKLSKILEDKDLSLRVGLHSGPVAAGVVGFRKPRYCLFGDTVNTASRMMSHGLPGKTQMSHASAVMLRENHPALTVTSRGTIRIKNKEPMETFWLD